MIRKRSVPARRARCHIRSECTARSNNRFFRKMLRGDWNELVIRRDHETGEYKVSTA
jgi:hypothetical protein